MFLSFIIQFTHVYSIVHSIFLDSNPCILSNEALMSNPPNFKGMEMKVVYDSWPPYCIVDPISNNVTGGIFYDILEVVSKHLNFKPM